jgi:anticodon tRNA-binding protein
MTSVALSTPTSERISTPGSLPAAPAADAVPSIAHYLSAPDVDAGVRLGLRAGQSWTPAGERLLARIRKRGAPRRVEDLTSLRALVEAWATELELRWVRVEHGPEFASAARQLPAPSAALARGQLRCVGGDSFGRRVVLGEARHEGEAWSLDLAPQPEALLEHLLESGRWPLWLAEVQVWVLPVQGAQVPAGEALAERLRAAGLRAECQEGGPLGSRIHAAARGRIPALCVLGPRELASGQVNLRWRGAPSHEPLTEEALLRVLGSEVHPFHPAEAPSASLRPHGTRQASQH